MYNTYNPGDLVETVIGNHLGLILEYLDSIDYYNVYLFEKDMIYKFQDHRIRKAYDA